MDNPDFAIFVTISPFIVRFASGYNRMISSGPTNTGGSKDPKRARQ